MSYEPTTWKDGDLVTSAKLNKLEQGVASAGGSGGGGVLVVHEDENGALDKTWQEIHDADLCVLKDMGETGTGWIMIGSAYNTNGNVYIVTIQEAGQIHPDYYTTDNPNGYPAYDDERSSQQ